jgi:hypothetical protein
LKAHALCAPQPILLLALEDYYNEPSVACLSRLYNAINAMDLSTLPLLSLDERLILRTSERKDMFEEKFADSASTTTTTTDGASSSIHLRRTPSSQSLSRSNGSTEVLDTFDHRSGSSGSISSLTSISKDPGTYDNSTDDLSWRTRSRANTVNSSEDGRPQFAGIQLMPGGERATTPAVPSGRPKDTHWFDSKIEYNGIQLPIRLPLATFPDEIGDVRPSVCILFLPSKLTLSRPSTRSSTSFKPSLPQDLLSRALFILISTRTAPPPIQSSSSSTR